MILAVLWDNDGVLVDSETSFFEITRTVFAQGGIDLTKQIWGIEYLGEGRGSRDIARSLGADPVEIDEMVDERNEQYRMALREPRWKILPGVCSRP